MVNGTKTVYKYRCFCTTENTNVYTWSSTPPTQCPRNAGHTIDPNSITVIDTVATNNVVVDNVPRCPYGEWRVAEKSLVIELKSSVGKSKLRDIERVTNSGTVTNVVGDAEYHLETPNANSTAALFSAERGRYISGIGAEIGIGVRIPDAPVGNQVFRWGLFDQQDGFFYQLTASGLSLVVRRSGVDEVIPGTSFNGVSLDSIGWEPQRGYVYNIMFSWYGYGSVSFYIQNKPNYLEPFSRIHTYDPFDKTSLKNPNLPLCASIENNGTASLGELFVAGRQYSVLGKYIPIYRLNGAFRISCPINSTTTFLPVLSVRRKAGTNSVAVKISGMDMNSTTTQLVQIRVGTTLTNSSFATLPDQDPTETVMEVDTTATTVTGGVIIWTGLVSSDKSAVQKLEDFTYLITEYSNVTLCARGTNATNGSMSVCLRMSEEW